MVPRETENNVYAKFGVTNKDHYGMLKLPYFLEWSIGNTRRVLFENPPGSVEDLKKLHFA